VIEETEDISMTLFAAGGARLVSRELALIVAETVFKIAYGEDDFSSQLPLNVSDGADRWVIEGSRRPEDHPPPEGEPAKGRVEIVILKRNCRIVRLVQHGRLT
jgi:hypothetical protein